MKAEEKELEKELGKELEKELEKKLEKEWEKKGCLAADCPELVAAGLVYLAW